MATSEKFKVTKEGTIIIAADGGVRCKGFQFDCGTAILIYSAALDISEMVLDRLQAVVAKLQAEKAEREKGVSEAMCSKRKGKKRGGRG